MKWNIIKTEQDIEELQKVYGDFEDSLLVNFRFESGNYVDEKLTGYENNTNDLFVLFQRQDRNPLSIEILFEGMRKINFTAPYCCVDNYTADILFAKLTKNDKFFYWTEWNEFDPYNEEHLKYNDFTLIEACGLKWRIVS